MNKQTIPGILRSCMLIPALFLAGVLSAQTSRLQVKITNSSSYPAGSQGNSGSSTNNSALNGILTTYGASSLQPAYPTAYIPGAVSSDGLVLKQYYFITVSTANASNLKNSLQSCSSCGCEQVLIMPQYQLAYQPNDYNLTGDVNGTWYLDKIQAKQAWDISKGDNIKIAIIDEGFDRTHQDFAVAGKVFYDQYGGASWGLPMHGTGSASIAAGTTDDNKGLSSIGFNARLGFYDIQLGGEAMLAAANGGANVISVSVLASNAGDQAYQIAVNEAYNKGCFIVASAGNGFRTNTLGPTEYEYPASFDNVFSVTSVTSDDTHRPQDPSVPNDGTMQHNDKVDLCAPAYHIWHAIADGNNGYAFGDGSSWAAPLVAGTVALMKSANPCLTNGEIENILKQSSDDISGILDNWKYAGKLGAGRLNAYKAVKMAKEWGSLIVSNNMTLANTNVIYTDIRVKAGASLTIDHSTISMKKNGKITVEASAKLIIRNQSTIKSLPWSGGICSSTPYYWDGIIVEGSASKDQAQVNQGYVSISNSTIQNAINAISTYAKDGSGSLDMTKTGGGIVTATNAIFKNNGRHLEFAGYHAPKTSAGEPNNASGFYYCKFLVDDDRGISPAIFPSGGNRVMITLYDIKGVKFTGCTYANDFDLTSNDKGTGILAVDASLIIQNDKNTGGARNLFQNLEYGIHTSYSPYSNKPLYLNNTDFLANRYGVVVNEGIASSIYRNNFDLRNTTFTTGFNPVGLQTLNSSGFKITENAFVEGLQVGVVNRYAPEKFGCEVRFSDRYSGAVPNSASFYTLNAHNNIKYGTSTEGDNSLLDITCNGYNYNQYGLWLNISTSLNKPPSFGTCANNPTDYNNTFTRNMLYAPTNGQYIGGEDAKFQGFATYGRIEYVVKPTLPLRPEPDHCLFMTVTDCHNAPNNPTVNPVECINLFPPEPKPNDGIYDQWNPDPKKDAYLQLRQTIPNYPDESHTPTPDMMGKYKQLAKLRSEVVYSYSNLLLFDAESDNSYYDDYLEFLENDATSESKKMLVAAYYSNSDNAKAANALQSIPYTTEENRTFVDYYTIMLALRNAGKSIYQLNDAQQTSLRNIAAGSTLTSASAKGVITLVYGDKFDHTPQGTGEESGSGQNGGGQTSQDNAMLLVYPNPALIGTASALTIQYSITGAYDNATLKVLNSMGETRFSTPLTQSSGQVEVSTASLGVGMFVAQLTVNGAVVSYKIVNLVQ